MKAKKYWILTVAIVVLAIAFASVGTQDTDEKAIRKEVKELLQEAEKQLTLLEMEDDVRSLAGLTGVHIVVDFNPNHETYRLTKEQIQTDIELRLRQHNIKVISEGAFLIYLHSIKETDPNQWQALSRIPTWALLCVEVDYISLDMLPVCTYRTGIRIRQPVILARDKNIFCIGITWSTDAVGVAGITILADEVRKSLKDYVDEFINDYLAANPKHQKDK